MYTLLVNKLFLLLVHCVENVEESVSVRAPYEGIKYIVMRYKTIMPRLLLHIKSRF